MERENRRNSRATGRGRKEDGFSSILAKKKRKKKKMGASTSI